MTRKELSQIYFLTKELNMWEDRLHELRASSIVGATKITGMPRATGNSDTVYERARREMEIIEVIDVFRINILEKRQQIERHIQTVDDSLIRMILEYRCCQLMTWEQVAAKIGAGTTAESCRKMFERKYPKC